MLESIHPTEIAQHQAICHRCRSIAGSGHPFCTECGLRRPTDGWANLRDEVDPWLGRVVEDRYLVSQVLGVGATARVYRVQCLSRPRRFALKIVELNRSRLGKPEQIAERVRREADAASSIDSPHVVPVHEVLRPSRHTLGMLMGFAEGRTLDDIVREVGPLPVAEALRILRHAALGLRAAHDRGFVHRDVKPANLMVHRHLPQGPFTRVMDFGIVYVGGDELTTGFLGTPMYTSPEQADGTVVTPASDVYSLGATLYFALTGEPPFNRSNAVAAIRAHALDPVPRLSDAGGSRFAPELEAFIARLLAKEPADRPTSMSELVAELDRLEETSDFDHVVRSSLRDTTELLGLSETITESAEHPPAVVPTGHCMVPFPIEGQFATGGLAAMARGRIVSLVDNDVAVTNLSPRMIQRVPVDFASQAEALAVSDRHIYIGTRDGRLLRDEDSWWSTEGTLDEPIAAVATSRDDHVLAAGTSGGSVHIRRNGTWSRAREGSPVRALAASSSGGSVAYSTWDHVEILAGELSTRLDLPDVRTLCFSEDEYLLAAGTHDGTVTVWTVTDGAHRIHRVHRSSGQLLGLYFARDTLLGLWREAGDAFLIDMQCSMSAHCAPSCLRCHEA